MMRNQPKLFMVVYEISLYFNCICLYLRLYQHNLRHIFTRHIKRGDFKKLVSPLKTTIQKRKDGEISIGFRGFPVSTCVIDWTRYGSACFMLPKVRTIYN